MKLPYPFVTFIYANNMINHSCPLQIVEPDSASGIIFS
jgi:hypothetical protein